MAKLKKGMRLACVPCGRQVVVDACGVSAQTVLCCGKRMAHKRRVSKTMKKRTY